MKKLLIDQLKRIHRLNYDKENIQEVYSKIGIQEYDNPKTADFIDPQVDSLLNNLKSIDKPIQQQSYRDMTYQKNVETVQVSLELLGYKLPVFGVDGLYGPETAESVKKFKSDNELKDVDGSVVTLDVIKILFDKLKEKNVSSKDIERLTDKKIGGGSSGEFYDDKLNYKNVIIGDSQTPYVDMNTTKATRIPYLCKGGVGVNWLRDRLSSYKINGDVENVILVIGTNGVFGKSSRDDINGLFREIKRCFPNAKIIVVQGSWGWTKGNNVTIDFVRNYYKKYEELGGVVIEPPIGEIEPHQNHKIYSVIGKKIDSLL